MSLRADYAERIEILMRAAQRLDARTLKSIFALLTDVKKEVAAQVASSDWDAARIGQLKGEPEC